MSKKLTKLSELQASMLIAGALAVLFLIGAVVGLFFNLPGLLIGVAIGTVFTDTAIFVFLKEEKTGLFLFTYFIRVALFVGLFALLVILDYRLHFAAFRFSCWAMLVAFAPSTFITIAIQLMHREKK